MVFLTLTTGPLDYIMNIDITGLRREEIRYQTNGDLGDGFSFDTPVRLNRPMNSL